MVKTSGKKSENEAIEILSKVSIFENLEYEDLEFLAQNAKKRVIHANKFVMKEGDEGDSMFMVAEGLLIVTVKKENNTSLEVATLRSGNYFGEVGLITGEKRTASVETLVDSTLYEISKDVMQELLNNHKYLVRTLSKAVAKRQVAAARKVIKVEKEEERQQELEKVANFNFEKILKFFNIKAQKN